MLLEEYRNLRKEYNNDPFRLYKKLKSNVYVISDLVETFDGSNNDASTRHNNALNEMKKNGANIVTSTQILKKIILDN